MKIDQIEFACSSPSLKLCPKEDLPEFAFIGRSNVGKSSLINMLAGRKGLAKVSGTPGKTRMINHFRVQSAEGKNVSGSQESNSWSWFLVDLPGYGFAKLSKTERGKFELMIRNYLQKRENLALTFVLVDSRLEPQQIDLEFLDWMGDQELPLIILFTKCDKLTRSELARNLDGYRRKLSLSWSELPQMITTSASDQHGRAEVLSVIGNILKEISRDNL